MTEWLVLLLALANLVLFLMMTRHYKHREQIARDALEYYADGHQYQPELDTLGRPKHPGIYWDRGQRAREALIDLDDNGRNVKR